MSVSSVKSTLTNAANRMATKVSNGVKTTSTASSATATNTAKDVASKTTKDTDALWVAGGGLVWAGLSSLDDGRIVRDHYEKQTNQSGFVPGVESFLGGTLRRGAGILLGGGLGYVLGRGIGTRLKLSRWMSLIPKLPLAFIGAELGLEFAKHYWPSKAMQLGSNHPRRSSGLSPAPTSQSLNATGQVPWDTHKMDPYGAYYGYRPGIDANNDGWIDGQAPLAMRDAAEIRAERSPRRRIVNGEAIDPRYNPPVHPRHPDAPPYGDAQRAKQTTRKTNQPSALLTGPPSTSLTSLPSGTTLLNAFNQNPDAALQNLQALANQYSGGNQNQQRGWL